MHRPGPKRQHHARCPFQLVAQHVGHDTAFAPFVLFTSIIAAQPKNFRRLGLAAFRQPCHRNQYFIDKIRQSVVAHPVELVLQRRKRRELLRHCAHWQPVITMYWIAFHNMRGSCSRSDQLYPSAEKATQQLPTHCPFTRLHSASRVIGAPGGFSPGRVILRSLDKHRDS